MSRLVTSEYQSLSSVLDEALSQAQSGKGKERHACDQAFESQQICQIPRWQKSVDFCTGQAIKKCLEITNLPESESKVWELLGAINYIAAVVIVIREKENGSR